MVHTHGNVYGFSHSRRAFFYLCMRKMTIFLVAFPIVMKAKDKRLPSKQSAASNIDFYVGSVERALKETWGFRNYDYETDIA